MTEFFDALETRDPAERERALMAALSVQVAHAKANTGAFAELLADIEPARIDSRTALARLPVTRKHELLARQQALQGTDVFGGYAALRRPRKVFQSPGPIYEPEGPRSDYWRMARALFAAGFRAGDLAHNSFSYHLTPAGSMMESGAEALGCTVFPAGVGNTDLQAQAIAELRPQGYVGTPSFLKILMDRAGGPTSITKALLSGEAFPAVLRDWLWAERGIAAFQCYGTADLGLIAYETAAREGLVLDEGVIVEIVRPGSGEPAPEGEVGEVVVTTLNPDYPLIRFGTGDLSALLPGTCPTGRTHARIRGWLGRADQSAKVRGMFVHAGQIAEIARRFPEVGRTRLVIEGEMAEDRMTLKAEVSVVGEGLAQRIAVVAREITRLRAEIELLPMGSLPNDGRVIEDLRPI